MNKELENWFHKNDESIKQKVNDIVDRKHLSVKFQGYYIEDNGLIINGSVRPIYKSFNQFIEHNPYSEITHIRYFFEIIKEKLSKTMTIILEKDGQIHLGFSIEELGGGVSLNDEDRLLTSDFSLLETYISNKF